MLLIKNSHPLQLINIFGKQLVVLWQHCDLCTISHWWHCPHCSLHLILHLLSVVGEEATGGAPHPVHLLGVRGMPGIWYYVDWDPIKSWNIHIPHPSWMGQSAILATREVVYYILSGTLRSPQKCLWPHLRVEISGENHLLLIYGKTPNQTLQLT